MGFSGLKFLAHENTDGSYALPGLPRGNTRGLRGSSHVRFALMLGAAIVVVSSGCGPQNVHTTDDSTVPILAVHHGTEETLLAATSERLVIARAVYPPDSAQTGRITRPTQLKVITIDTETADRALIDSLFGQPMADVPVTDGRWLAALDGNEGVWLADLDSPSVQPVALDALPAGVDSLWLLHYPWLVVSTPDTLVVHNVQTGQSIDLPPGSVPTTLTMDDHSVAYMVGNVNGTNEIRLLDLGSGTSTPVVDLDSAQFFLFQNQLLYITLDVNEGAYYVRGFKPDTEEAPILLRLRQMPKPDETESIVGVGLRGYLILHERPNGIYVPLIDMDIMARSGDLEFIASNGVIAENMTVRNQPQLAGDDHLVFRDTNDGFWVIDNLETFGSRRVNPFPTNPAP